MPEDVAKYHIKRCVDSGLWVPNADDDNKSDNEPKTSTAANKKEEKPKQKKEEPVYAGVNSDDLD